MGKQLKIEIMNNGALSIDGEREYLQCLGHYSDMADRRSQEYDYEFQVIRLMKELEIVPYRDGNQWCALYGKNIQEGIAGFGDTPFSSMEDLKERLYKK